MNYMSTELDRVFMFDELYTRSLFQNPDGSSERHGAHARGHPTEGRPKHAPPAARFLGILAGVASRVHSEHSARYAF